MNRVWLTTNVVLWVANIVLALVFPMHDMNTLVFVRGLFLGGLMVSSTIAFVDSIDSAKRKRKDNERN